MNKLLTEDKLAIELFLEFVNANIGCLLEKEVELTRSTPTLDIQFKITLKGEEGND